MLRLMSLQDNRTWKYLWRDWMIQSYWMCSCSNHLTYRGYECSQGLEQKQQRQTVSNIRKGKAEILASTMAHSPPQQHWLSKLMDHDFILEYQAGYLNKDENALSRMTPEDPSLNVISYPRSTLLEPSMRSPWN
ncbi:hypothetical protein HAX54_021085 [Datura stramonium]|uniref:Uncharacterized protein n=1 Tax=Datura stramonium TaxID=4076 RepID=A0ABS8UUI9_DATST|nr:hypothetical protein [Datura stramonium]